MSRRKSSKLNYSSRLVAVGVLLIGMLLGFVVNNLLQAKPASAKEIEQAKTDITKLYKGKTVDACWQVNKGANLAAEKYEITYRNLRVNKYANRAIITDCGENDTLLFKNKSGQWKQSSVGVMIFSRVNPEWQKACKIQDITVADDRVRPENSSIDADNLTMCKQISKQ